MNIREIKDFELGNALNLVWEVFLKFEAIDYTEEGIKEFKDSIDNPEFIGKMKLFGAFINENLVGVIGTRDKHHISLLFIKEEFHRQGIGRALYNFVCDINPDNFITVNSSPFAKPFYEHLGFKCLLGEQCIKGIRYYPMEKIFK